MCPLLASPLASAADSFSDDPALALLGPSQAMARLWAQIRYLASTGCPALLSGPAQSGQQAVLRLLLELAPGSRRHLLVLPPAEAEVELATFARIHAAPRELLVYLPEVDRLSQGAQAGLLRLLLRRSRGLSVVVGTGVDLQAEVHEGSFSPKLYELLSPLQLVLPPLRQRPEDLPMLFNQLLASLCQGRSRKQPRLSEDLLHAAMLYKWPGNLRELSAVARHLAHGGAGELRVLSAEDLDDAIAAVANTASPAAPAAAPVRMVRLETVMQEHIHAVLRACRGNKLRAAETLGISRSTLYRMLETGTGALPVAL